MKPLTLSLLVLAVFGTSARPPACRADFLVRIQAGMADVTLRPNAGEDFINLIGTYGSLRIADFSSTARARVTFVDTDRLDSLTLTNAVMIDISGAGVLTTIDLIRDFNGPPDGDRLPFSVHLDGVFQTASNTGNLAMGTSYAFQAKLEGGGIGLTPSLTAPLGGRPSGTAVDPTDASSMASAMGMRRMIADLVFKLGPDERFLIPGSAVARLSAVPEPSSLALLSLGCCLTILARRFFVAGRTG